MTLRLDQSELQEAVCEWLSRRGFEFIDPKQVTIGTRSGALTITGEPFAEISDVKPPQAGPYR
jgi:hypothetical protein